MTSISVGKGLWDWLVSHAVPIPFLMFVLLLVLPGAHALGGTGGCVVTLNSDEIESSVPFVGEVQKGEVQTNVAELPLSFIANAGQVNANVRFMVKAGKRTIFFAPQEIVFAASEQMEDELTRNSVVRLRFAGANEEVKVEGEKPLSGVANFFLGNDPERWHANVRPYAAITYYDLYPGMDLVYRGKQRRLKREFVVATGADRELAEGIQHRQASQQARFLDTRGVP